MSLQDVLSTIQPDPEHNERKRKVLEQVERLNLRLHNSPGSLADRELLLLIEDLFGFVKGSEVPFDEDYDPFIRALSFTRRSLDEADVAEIKTAWTRFLNETFGHENTWELPFNEGMGLWYRGNDMPAHAIAVYEHLYMQIRRGELSDYELSYEDWLLRLFRLCVEQGLTERARHVAGLIEDYHTDGLVGLSGYAEVLALQGALRYQEFGEVIEHDRSRCEQALHSEFGSIFERLHPLTRSLIVDAEVWSHARLRAVEPAAGPRRWSLAIEAEFHYKVFEARRTELASAFDPPLREGKSCGPGEIFHLLRLSGSRPLIRAVFAELQGGQDLGSPANTHALKVIREHRHQTAHITERGPYTRERCDEFLKVVRDSGWVFRFLTSLQPRL